MIYPFREGVPSLVRIVTRFFPQTVSPLFIVVIDESQAWSLFSTQLEFDFETSLANMHIRDSLPCLAVVTKPSGPIGLSSVLLAASIASRISQYV